MKTLFLLSLSVFTLGIGLSHARINQMDEFAELYEQGLSQVQTRNLTRGETERSVGGLTCRKKLETYRCSLSSQADFAEIYRALDAREVGPDAQDQIREKVTFYKAIGGLACRKIVERKSPPLETVQCYLTRSDYLNDHPNQSIDDATLEKTETPAERNESRDGGSFPRKSFDHEAGSL